MTTIPKHLLLKIFSAFAIPITDPSGWVIETYSKIPANKSTFTTEGLKVNVNKSASPLIYKFQEPREIKSFKVEGYLSALYPDFEKQGSASHDDFPLRIGFVLPGTKKLSALEKWMAAGWVVRLFSLVPKDMGLDKIVFYNMTQNKTLMGTQRIHPLSEYIQEKFSFLNIQAGDFKWEQNLETPVTAAALWISIDGDDTKSAFELQIKNLTLN